MNAPKRVFPVETEPEGPFPLLIGLEGPAGGGKSLSALRLAAGIQRVRKGPIVVIDTEAGRSRMYHAQVPFSLVKFDPPCRPGDFLEAIKQQLLLEPSAIIVDSLSDEHEGPGGVLEWHEEEVDRRLKPEERNDWRRRDALAMAGWIKPKADRVRMVNGFLRITTPLIFTFRAREKTKPIKGADGKTVPTKVGYQAIAPAEIVHAMTLMCLLPPQANGVPVWRSESAGEDFLLKWPNFLQHLTGRGQLSEDIGENLGNWAAGSKDKPSVVSTANTSSPETAAVNTQTSPPTPPDRPAGGLAVAHAAPPADIDESERIDRIDAALGRWADQGSEVLKRAWSEISPADQKILKAALDRRHKLRAKQVDDEFPARPVS
jgi:hypothetical protein